jgi:hypothetical protein
METRPFRQCLHPTPLGFALGVLVIAFSLGLWLWLLVQLGGPSEGAKQARHSPPMVWDAAAAGKSVAGFVEKLRFSTRC